MGRRGGHLPLSYPARNLLARPGRTLVTATVVGLVVVACTLLLALLGSLRRTLTASGHPLNLVVLRKGSENDGASQVSRAAWLALRDLPGIARGTDGRPLVSAQLVVQPFLHRADGGRENVLVRGVDRQALGVHDRVRIAEGRFFRPRMGEAVVGRALVGRYEGAELGGTLRFGRGRWRVVGILEAGGSSFESEIWVDAEELARDARRPMPYSGIRLRARSEAALEELVRRIGDDPRHALEARRETEYYEEQADDANALYLLVVGIAVLAGLGAGFGAANTLYAAVASRTREIGTLRALGFSRSAVLRAFEVEALLLGLTGFAVGVLFSFLGAAALRALLGGVAFGAATFTTQVVVVRVGVSELLAALALSLTICAAGGIGPAWRAAGLRPAEALRRIDA